MRAHVGFERTSLTSAVLILICDSTPLHRVITYLNYCVNCIWSNESNWNRTNICVSPTICLRNRGPLNAKCAIECSIEWKCKWFSLNRRISPRLNIIFSIVAIPSQRCGCAAAKRDTIRHLSVCRCIFANVRPTLNSGSYRRVATITAFFNRCVCLATCKFCLLDRSKFSTLSRQMDACVSEMLCLQRVSRSVCAVLTVPPDLSVSSMRI